MIRHGIARITIIQLEQSIDVDIVHVKFVCKVVWVWIVACWRDCFVMRITDDMKLIKNGPKICIKEL